MTEPFIVTRTNTKRYVGHCSLCDYTTDVISLRANCALRLRDHARVMHNMTPKSLNEYLEPPRTKERRMKAPNKDLPPQEKLADYIGHLMVFGNVTVGATSSSFGMSVADALIWVWVNDAWKNLGPTPVFWPNVGRELLREIGPESDTPDETMGAYLRKGNHPSEKGDFYWLAIADSTEDMKLLKAWSKDHSDSF